MSQSERRIAELESALDTALTALRVMVDPEMGKQQGEQQGVAHDAVLELIAVLQETMGVRA